MKSFKVSRIIAMVMIFVISTTIYGCEKSNISSNNSSNKTNTNIQELNKNNKSNNENLDNKNEDVNNKNINNSNNKENKDTNNNGNKDNNKEINTNIKIIKLYSKDANNGEKIYIGDVEINENDSLKDKLTILANALSKKAFSGLPITLTEIKESNGKKIAIFDLNELGDNVGNTPISQYKGINWYNNYFSGSTGGDITQYTLINNLLQRGYSGEWINGVEFTYKGSKIEFDHVPDLGETNF